MIVAFSYFSSHSVDEKEMTRFQSENIFSKFLWRSVNYKKMFFKWLYLRLVAVQTKSSQKQSSYEEDFNRVSSTN